MRIIETRVNQAIEYTPEQEAYINTYYGCTAGCPFCYWLCFGGWENKIEVRQNIPQVLEETLRNGLKPDRLFIGSYCDPYMEGIEDVYGITRECLEIIRSHDLPLTVVSSIRNRLILRDVPLLKKMRGLRVVAELCRPDQIALLKKGVPSTNIEVANELAAAGIEVWATLAPYLPGITNPDMILRNLEERIPLYMDPLDIQKGTIQEERMIRFIASDYPELAQYYESCMYDSRPAFEEIMAEYKGNNRIKCFPMPQ